MRSILVLSGGLLAWSAVANLVVGDAGYVPRNLVATAGLLVLARAAGLTPSQLGTDRRRLRQGLLWGGGAVTVVAVVIGGGLLLGDRVGAIGQLLADDRADLAGAALAWAVLVRIPLGTALFEEVAFRGVLRAAARRVLSPAAATAWTSVTFGLWHVAPTVVALRINDVDPASPAGIGAIAGAVAVTTVAGVLFDQLRARSGSLAAPVLAHWATNALGLLAAAVDR